jgi:hypothetical protein
MEVPAGFSATELLPRHAVVAPEHIDRSNRPGRARAKMADRNGLGILGCIFGSVTVAVVLMAFVVVFSHVDGSLALKALPSAAAPMR